MPGPVRRATVRLVRLLRRHGYLRTPAQTVRELAVAVDATHRELGVTAVVDRLYRLRWSGRPLEAGALTEVRRDFARIDRDLTVARSRS